METDYQRWKHGDFYMKNPGLGKNGLTAMSPLRHRSLWGRKVRDGKASLRTGSTGS